MKRYEKYLLSEKAQISPYLNSMFKRTDTITKEEAEKLVKDLNKLTYNMVYIVSLDHTQDGIPLLKIRPSKSKDKATDQGVEQILNKNGFKKVSTLKIDGSPAITFNRK